jgi:hypothetical protein
LAKHSYAALQSPQLFLHAAGETFRADDGAFVQAAHDDFVLVAGFDPRAVFELGHHL